MTFDRFQYLAARVKDAEIVREPFPHLYIADFLSETDFKAITTADEVALLQAENIEQLFSSLERAGYEPIKFPGCTTSKDDYLAWITTSSKPSGTHAACEGQGMALRLMRPTSPDVTELNGFFSSGELADLLKEMFGLTGETRIEAGVQKYLHGYEIL